MRNYAKLCKVMKIWNTAFDKAACYSVATLDNVLMFNALTCKVLMFKVLIFKC